MPASISTSRADGFTMIELMVVVVLMSIVLAAALPMLLDTIKGTSEAAASVASKGERAVLVRQLSDDLRNARALNASAALARDGDSNPIIDLNSNDYRAHDLVWASRVGVAFWADVVSLPDAAGNDAEAGPEFVRWMLYYPGQAIAPHPIARIAPHGNVCALTDWCVVRYVDSGLTNTPLSREVMARGRAGTATPYPLDNGCLSPHANTAAPRLLCYRWAEPASFEYDYARWRPVCVVRPSASELDLTTDPGAGNFNSISNPNRIDDTRDHSNNESAAWNTQRIVVEHPRASETDANARTLEGTGDNEFVRTNIYSLDRVVNVGIVAPGTSAIGSSVNTSATVTNVSIRYRQTPAYLTAIACGDR